MCTARHRVFVLHAHLVFVTRYRHPVFAAASPAASRAPISLLRQYIEQRTGGRPEFRRFWLGMMISRVGDAFTTVTLSWVVVSIAGAFQLGLVLMCYGLPRIVSGPVAGRLIDRYRPRVLLTVDNAARGC
jgi:hypothetical protein